MKSYTSIPNGKKHRLDPTCIACSHQTLEMNDEPPSSPDKPTAGIDLSAFSTPRARSGGRRLSSAGGIATPSRESKTNPRTPNADPLKAFEHQSKATPRRRLSSTSRIHRLSAEDAERVRGGQALGDVRAVAKELLENALDAGASRIDITLRGPGGLDGVIVSDDGCGVKSEDFLDLCTAGATSKQEGGTTFGFRGTALSSVCATSRAVRVVTRTGEPNSSAFSLEYSTRGVLTMRKPAARRPGTTVEACEIFKNLPVRRTAVKDHASREIAKVVAMAQAYALVSTHTRIELRVDKQSRLCYVPLATERGIRDAERDIDLSLLRHSTRAILGVHVLNKLVDFTADGLGVENGIRANVSGLVSSGAGGSAKGSGKGSANSPQFIFINRRPVDMARLTRAVNDAYRRGTGNPGARPSFILNLSLDPESVDVNLAPDKRAVLCEGEPAIVNALAERLEKMWAPVNESSIPKTADVRSMLKPGANARPVENEDLTQLSSQGSGRNKESCSGVVRRTESELFGSARRDGDLPFGVSVNESHLRSRKREELTSTQESKLRSTIDNFVTVDDGSPAHSSKRSRAQEMESTSPRESESLADGFARFREMETNKSPSRPSKRGRVSNIDSVRPLAVSQKAHEGNGNSGGIRDLVGEYDETSETESESTGSANDGRRERTKARKQKSGTQSISNERMMNIVQSFRQSVFKRPTNRGDSSPSLAPLKRVSPELERLHKDGIVRKTNTGNFQREPSRWRNVINEPPHKAPSSKRTVTDVSLSEIPVPDHPAFTTKPRTVKEVLDSRAGERSYSKKVVVDMDWNAVLSRRNKGGVEVSASEEEREEEQLPKLDFQESSMTVVNEVESQFQQAKAVNQLKRTFKKEWFEKMEVLGQFNLGFFICRLGDELFIIDQHASDEIRNFEELKAVTPATQKLVTPMQLKLSAEEELLVAEYMDNFAAGGYSLRYHPDRAPTARLELVAQPSRSSFYVMDDIAEMAAAVKFNPPQPGEPLAPRRTRSAIASKACRRSVMVGHPLQPARMQKIVANLAKLRHPWLCPHGRPTFLHLCAIPEPPQRETLESQES